MIDWSDIQPEGLDVHTQEPARAPGQPARLAAPPRAAAPGLGLGLGGFNAGSVSPQAVLALQRSVGNAAVSRMIEESRHQHGAGCGHGQAGTDATAPVQRSAVHDVLRSGGSPLDNTTRSDMEARLGADFSDVRVHNDGAARASAAEVGARAYTSGNHVVIGDGGADKHTLAHELTHVIQQRQGPVAGTDTGSGLSISDPSDRFEREAETNATRVMSGSAPDRTAAAADPATTSEPTGAGGTAALQRMNTPVAPPGGGPIRTVPRAGGTPFSPTAGRPGGAPGQPGPSTGPAPAPTVEQIDFQNTVPLTGGHVNTSWTPAAPSTANVTYVKGEQPRVNVRVSNAGQRGDTVKLEAQRSDGTVLAASQMPLLSSTMTFGLNLATPDAGVGTEQQDIHWSVTRVSGPSQQPGTASAPQLLRATTHHIHRLFARPGTARTEAVEAAMGMLHGQTGVQDTATALRQGIRSRVDYDAANAINDDPLTVLTDAVGVCTDFANLLALLARTVGLQANVAMFWGGFDDPVQNQMVWVANTPVPPNTTEYRNLTNVRATDPSRYHNPPGNPRGWDFQYHAVTHIGGVLHDAALNRTGYDAEAVHQGLRVHFRRIIPQTLMTAQVGHPYGGAIPRQEETVGVTVRQFGNQITSAAFPYAHVLNVAPGTDPYFAPVLASAGPLPPGIQLDAVGMLHGVPTTAGTFPFLVNSGPQTPGVPFNLVVNP